MATKKGKKTKGKKIKVTKPRKKPKASKKRKRGRGRGQYSNFFPTNRQVDSNQYWQLRAEIAGAEARVRTGLRDQKDDESKAKKKAETKVEKLEKEVAALTPQAAPTVNVTPNITLVSPDGGGGRDADREYNSGENASTSRRKRRGTPEKTPPPTRSRSTSPTSGSRLSRAASSALDSDDDASRAALTRPTRQFSPPVNPGHGSYSSIGVSGLATPRGQPPRRSPSPVPSGIGTRIPPRERPRQPTPAGGRVGGGGVTRAEVRAVLPARPDQPEDSAQRARGSNDRPLSASAAALFRD